MNACHEKKRFTSNQLFEFVKTLKKNEMRYMRTKTSDRKSDRRISFLSSSNSSRHQKRKISLQQSKLQSKQSKHQNENQSDKQLKQQRQQTKKQHQQKIQFQQSQIQSFEQHQSFSFDEISISFWTFSIFSKSSAFRASKSHDRVLFNLIKMYSDETKYSDENDSWNFKFIIFHDMCAKVEMFETIKLMTFSIMLKDFALNYYYFNVIVWESALNFVQTCVSINSYFENSEYKRNVMIKWNVIIFRSVMTISKH